MKKEYISAEKFFEAVIRHLSNSNLSALVRVYKKKDKSYDVYFRKTKIHITSEEYNDASALYLWSNTNNSFYIKTVNICSLHFMNCFLRDLRNVIETTKLEDVDSFSFTNDGYLKLNNSTVETGMPEALKENVVNLLSLGKTPRTISKLTGLSPAYIKYQIQFYSPKFIENVIFLYRQGKSYESISCETGFSVSHIKEILVNNSIPLKVKSRQANNAELINSVISLYNDGKSKYYIGKTLKIHTNVVREIINNPVNKDLVNYSAEAEETIQKNKIEKIINLYRENKSMAFISRETGMSNLSIQSILTNNNLPLRKQIILKQRIAGMYKAGHPAKTILLRLKLEGNEEYITEVISQIQKGEDITTTPPFL